MLPDRLFRRLDRARLDATLLRRSLLHARPWMEELAAGHAAFAGGGEPRPHRRRGGRIVFELHGRCRRRGAIEIFARTAARERPVALKTLLETLLHEFVHHHDFSAFDASVHCSGFYERLGQLYRPLRRWAQA
jgi:hypothetical protein